MPSTYILHKGDADDTDLKHKVVTASADGAITIQNSTVVATKGSAAALTLATPTATTHDGIEITVISATAYAHTVTTPTNKINGASAIATFGGAKGDGITLIAYQGVWYVKRSTNITLS